MVVAGGCYAYGVGMIIKPVLGHTKTILISNVMRYKVYISSE